MLSTDRRLILLTGKGTFRVRVFVESLPYSTLKPGVASRDAMVFSSKAFLAGIGDNSGRIYTMGFFTPEERDEFVSDVGGALGGWHILHQDG